VAFGPVQGEAEQLPHCTGSRREALRLLRRGDRRTRTSPLQELKGTRERLRRAIRLPRGRGRTELVHDGARRALGCSWWSLRRHGANHTRKTEEAPRSGGGLFQVRECLGGDLLSHPVTRAVPSALEGLTSGFGMGPGVPPPPWPPKRYEGASLRTDPELDSEREQSQVLGLLVPVG